MRYELMIDEVAPSPNVYLRAHWSRYSGIKRRWCWLVAAAGNRPTTPFLQARVGIMRYGKRLLDPDNLVGAHKPTLDALRACGYIADDSASHIDLDIRQERVPRGQEPCTLIMITDLSAPAATGESCGHGPLMAEHCAQSSASRSHSGEALEPVAGAGATE